MPICGCLSKMIQSVAENDIIRADRVRIGSVLSRIRTHVYRIVSGCKQSAKSVNNLYTSVFIEMRFGSLEFGQSSDSDMDILKPNLKSRGLKVEPGLNSCLRDGDTTLRWKGSKSYGTRL
jgi:hypothetical protein